MGFWSTILDLLRSITGGNDAPTSDRTEDPSIEPPTTPLTSDESGDEATTLEVSIHQTAALTQTTGRVPEQNVARFLAAAVSDAGYNYQIKFDHPEVPGDYAAADGTALGQWASRSYDSDHVNLLLQERAHNGIAYVGKRAAIAPAGEVTELVEVTDSGEGPILRNIRAALHEVGHTLGGQHVDGMIPAPNLLYQNVEADWMDSPAPGKTETSP